MPRELAAIQQLLGGVILLDREFSSERLEKEVKTSRPTVLHLASHAVFTGDPSNSFVLTHGVAVSSGARSALGSLWPISDEATYRLVVDFYTELARPGVSRAQALQRSQQRLMTDEGFSHPYFWSGFLLISNWL